MFYNKLVDWVSSFYHWMIQFELDYDSENDADDIAIYNLII